jgi:hypothetical protein
VARQYSFICKRVAMREPIWRSARLTDVCTAPAVIELPVVLLQWRCISSSSSSSSSVTPATTPRSPPTAPRSLSHLHSPSPQQRHAPRIPLGPRATSGSGGSPAGLASSSAAVDTRDAEAEQAGWELYVVDTFHTHVKPSWRPRLTRFCRELTGVDQVSASCWPRRAKREVQGAAERGVRDAAELGTTRMEGGWLD